MLAAAPDKRQDLERVNTDSVSMRSLVAGHLHALARRTQVRLYHWREGNHEVDLGMLPGAAANRVGLRPLDLFLLAASRQAETALEQRLIS